MKKLCSSKITVFFIAFGLIITAFLCGLDQFTKFLAQSRLRGSEGFSVISGVLELRYVENRGIAWGMLQGKIPLFLVFSLLFFIFLGFMAFYLPKTKRYLPLMIVWVLMCSGAMGNFLDRIFRGYVVDFIYLSCIRFPVFNVADICVVCGGAYLAWLILFYYKDEDFIDLRGKR